MRFDDDGPRISCVMVTANRVRIARRAVACFAAQGWGNRELVVVDDGAEDYAPLFAALPPDRVRYLRVAPSSDNTLGALRNRSLDEARGEIIAQWDDDDWYHPDRLSAQAAMLDAGHDACVLRGTLMHLDDPRWFDHPYVGTLEPGVPGSIVHRADASARYPEKRRGEDTDFLGHWSGGRLAVLDAPQLFLRAFHGANTWERTHFERRVRNTPAAAVEWWWRAQVLRRPWTHRRFRLSPEQAAAFAAYLRDSRTAGLFA